MAQGPDGKTIIIVKKVSGHGGHHGGAWKVAYADFVTAMMALFLVLWLVNSASVVTRERIASYFRRPGVFEEGSGTPLELGRSGILPDTFAPPSEANSQVIESKEIYEVETPGGIKKEGFPGGSDIQKADDSKAPNRKAGDKTGGDALDEQRDVAKVASELNQEIAQSQQQIAGFIGQMSVKVDQRGLHLEIMDTAGASMFQQGSARILPEAEKELAKIAQSLAKLPNPIDIEGHTDANPFKIGANRYDNWNLSSDRAHAARRVFQQHGLMDQQIARVAGYAAQRPKDSSNPKNPANRRISISMRYTEQAASALSGKPITESVGGKPSGVDNTSVVQAPTEQLDNDPLLPSAIEIDEKILSQQNSETEGGGDHLKQELSTTLPEGAKLAPNILSEGEVPTVVPAEGERVFDPFK